MIIGVVVAMVVSSARGVTVFGLIQQVFFYVAPPISAAFLVGILWPRTTSVAATTTLVLGFIVYLPIVVFWVFPNVQLLAPYDNFMHHTFAVFLLSILTLFLISIFTRPKQRSELEGVIWTRSALRIGKSEKVGNRGTRSLFLGWLMMVVVIFSLYAYTHFRAGNTELVEAEDLEYAVSGLGSTRIQARRELDNFNLWTGQGQVLFDPVRQTDRLIFQLPVSRRGRYRVAIVVTRGPSYGRFQVEVNREQAGLIVPETVLTSAGDFRVVYRRTRVFNANRIVNGGGQREGIAGSHLVKRICLGDFDLLPGINQITFQPVGFSENGSQIGVDQFVLTPLDR
jgi:hypothetical protein